MMIYYALKCDQGYLRGTETGCQCVTLDKATVVNDSDWAAMDALAQKASQAGCQNIKLIELLVTEGNSVKTY